MPGYEGFVDKVDTLLPWAWAEERLGSSHNYLVVTVRPDGRPHAMPVWGVWVDSAFLFSTGDQSRKAKNLAGNRHCVVTTEQMHETVIVEGDAAYETDTALLRPFRRAYKEKYDFDMETTEGVYAVRPRAVFGIVEDQSAEVGGVTRWTFDGAP
jgi:hypothetical protein